MRTVALASDIKLALIVETVAIGRVGKFALQLTSSGSDDPTREVLLGISRIDRRATVHHDEDMLSTLGSQLIELLPHFRVCGQCGNGRVRLEELVKFLFIVDGHSSSEAGFLMNDLDGLIDQSGLSQSGANAGCWKFRFCEVAIVISIV